MQPVWGDIGRLLRRAVRNTVAAARADELPTPAQLLEQHLGRDVSALPIVREVWPAYERANVQIGLERWLADACTSHRLIGVVGHAFSLADLLHDSFGRREFSVGNVQMTSLPIDAAGSTHPCVAEGLYLVDGPARMAIWVAPCVRELTVEVLCTDRELGVLTLAEIRGQAFEHNVFRGQVLSFGDEVFTEFEDTKAPVHFRERPTVARDDLILPPNTLEAVELHVIGVRRQAARLRASRQHLRRGLLLYGPPGTGKTHTVRYLLSCLEGVTTVVLTGDALTAVRPACSIARTLQPSVVVVEDIDLIASEREQGGGQQPFMFELFNEMDGLAGDADVVFLLTTNRADLLEPALAARPGRIDRAVAFELPDAAARRRLLDLYRGDLVLDGCDLDFVVERTAGMTASFIKELLRRAALVSSTTSNTLDRGPISVTDGQLRGALEDLLTQHSSMTRILLGGSYSDRHDPNAWLRVGAASRPAGFRSDSQLPPHHPM